MELSDGQFERLVGMLADNRVAISNLGHELSSRIEQINKNQIVLQSSIDCLEPELNQVQLALRTQASTLQEHTQALDGITQLTKSIFDVTESINQREIEESKRRAPSADVERHTQ